MLASDSNKKISLIKMEEKVSTTGIKGFTASLHVILLPQHCLPNNTLLHNFVIYRWSEHSVNKFEEKNSFELYVTAY